MLSNGIRGLLKYQRLLREQAEQKRTNIEQASKDTYTVHGYILPSYVSLRG